MSEIKIDEFVYKANPNEWLEVADEINHSIELLILNDRSTYIKNDTWNFEPKIKLQSSRSILFLMGLALENLLKGILIFDKPFLINTGKLNKEIKTHNLNFLFSKISDLNFNSNQLELIKILSDSIPDWGRYPTPLNYQNVKNEYVFIIDNKKIYESIRNTLRSLLIERLKLGWESGRENKRTNVKIEKFIEK